jgi:DNA-binding beta-propeller fold protein YncE
VASPEDFGIQPSFWKRLSGFLIGKAQERLIRPSGVAVLGSAMYIADPGAQSLWIFDEKAQRCRRIQRSKKERLICPIAVALGRDGLVYLADSYLAKVLIFDTSGRFRAGITHQGFRRPAGVAYDAARDRLYVSDSAAHCVWILTGEGALLGSIGRRGRENGEFNFPTHLALDKQGVLYVVDALGFRVQYFTPTPEAAFAGQFGRHGDTSGDLAMPKGIAVDSLGHIYVVDALFDAVQIFDREGRWLFTIGERGVRPAQFWLPGGIFIDPKDQIYVADSYNQRVQIFGYLAREAHP